MQNRIIIQFVKCAASSLTCMVMLSLCLVVLMGSCGYGPVGSGDFPYGIQQLAVDNLQNRTAETGLENTMTTDLIYELIRSGKVRITSKDEAEGILTGTITLLTDTNISRRGTITANARRLQLFLDLKLEGMDGKTLWTAENLTDNQQFEVAGDAAVTEANQRRALEILTRRLAEKIVVRLTEDF